MPKKAPAPALQNINNKIKERKQEVKAAKIAKKAAVSAAPKVPKAARPIKQPKSVDEKLQSLKASAGNDYVVFARKKNL